MRVYRSMSPRRLFVGACASACVAVLFALWIAFARFVPGDEVRVWLLKTALAAFFVGLPLIHAVRCLRELSRGSEVEPGDDSAGQPAALAPASPKALAPPDA